MLIDKFFRVRHISRIILEILKTEPSGWLLLKGKLRYHCTENSISVKWLDVYDAMHHLLDNGLIKSINGKYEHVGNN